MGYLSFLFVWVDAATGETDKDVFQIRLPDRCARVEFRNMVCRAFPKKNPWIVHHGSGDREAPFHAPGIGRHLALRCIDKVREFEKSSHFVPYGRSGHAIEHAVDEEAFVTRELRIEIERLVYHTYLLLHLQ
jgi:hypothetical protein